MFIDDQYLSSLFARYYGLSSPIYFDSIEDLQITRSQVMEILEHHSRAPYDGKIAIARFIVAQTKQREKEKCLTKSS